MYNIVYSKFSVVFASPATVSRIGNLRRPVFFFVFLFPLQTDKVSMLVMMPDDVNGSELMMERLAKDNFLDIVDSLGYQDAELMLPQLAAFTNSLDLEPFFKKLGVKTAFDQSTVGNGGANNKTVPTTTTTAGRTSKSPVVTLVSMKQNAYFSMSFITINSVGSVGTKLGQYKSSMDPHRWLVVPGFFLPGRAKWRQDFITEVPKMWVA